MIHLGLIVASTREGRLGGRVAEWFTNLAGARGDLAIDLIDLAAIALPERLPAAHPARGGRAPAVAPFAERVAAAEAFVIVTPEYNHGYPAALKQALDLLHVEWRAKPVSFVSYGGVSGGVRAVEQLRQVAVELHMAPVRDAVVLPMARRLFADGAPADPDGRIAESVGAMLDRLVWWAEALSAARRHRPYD